MFHAVPVFFSGFIDKHFLSAVARRFLVGIWCCLGHVLGVTYTTRVAKKICVAPDASGTYQRWHNKHAFKIDQKNHNRNTMSPISLQMSPLDLFFSYYCSRDKKRKQKPNFRTCNIRFEQHKCDPCWKCFLPQQFIQGVPKQWLNFNVGNTGPKEIKNFYIQG